MKFLPDLLSPSPELRFNSVALHQALAFAFATGSGSEPFDDIFNAVRVPASAFNPECFADDLFLSELVSRCFALRLSGERHVLSRGHFVRMLTHPPRDQEVVRFRQQILAELEETPELRRAAETALSAVAKLRSQLEAPERGKHGSAIQRRMEILRAVREALDAISGPFAHARSGLRRLDDFAKAAAQKPGYRDLSDLLDYEENLATVDLRVKVGHDGELRRFEIVRAMESTSNRFYVSPFGRFLTRLKLLFRGYRVREAEIVGRLANSVFDGVLDEVVSLLQLLVDLEFYLAALSFKDFAGSKGLSVCLPELRSVDGTGRTQLTQLFNPFLLLEERAPEPCNIDVEERAMVVVTGPNSGGKTRLLQALALTQLLGQAGLFVPAARAKFAYREGMFVSIAQEVAVDQREGRLGTELLRIRRLFERLSCDALVVLDELCSGTNPSEGEQIFRLVLDLLSELSPQAFITTHFLQFAARLSEESALPELGFLQVELDQHQHPTYQFLPGVAETSLARQTAERLGVTREALLGLVEASKRESRQRLAPLSSRSDEPDEARSRTRREVANLK